MNYEAPASLSETSKAIWRGVVPRRAKTAERLLLIKTALQALDRAEQVTAEIDKQGLSIENPSTGAIRVNPLVKVEKELRQQFSSIWGELGFNWHAVIDGGNKTFPINDEEIQQERADLESNEAAVKEFLELESRPKNG